MKEEFNNDCPEFINIPNSTIKLPEHLCDLLRARGQMQSIDHTW